jgi:hypothetical protein
VDSAGTDPVRCPRCHVGDMGKHCPKTNRCGWWCCDLPCGWTIDLSTGREYVDHRRWRSDPLRGRGVESARGDESRRAQTEGEGRSGP